MFARRSFLMAAAAVTLAWLPVAPPAQAQDGLKFEVYKDARAGFRWRLKAANGAVLATGGQSYKAKADCLHAIQVVQQAGTPQAKTSFEQYQDAGKKFRWRLKASNGQVMASSSESYKTAADCEKAIQLIKTGAAKAPVEEVAH